MVEKRNVLLDVTRIAAAAGIILCHVDLTDYGAVGTFFGQFLSARFSLMFFLTIIGFYLEKSYQAGKTPVPGRVASLSRVYGVWSLVYLALSFVVLVLLQKMPLSQYILSRVKGFFFSGTHYHFWFYPAVIYALVFIGGIKRLLGHRSLVFLLPLAVILYVAGMLGTGYLPIGRKIPGLRALYAAQDFETIMHLVFLGFPAVVFGMAAAYKPKECSGRALLAAAVMYVAECVILCWILGWREDPQMLISAPILTVLFLRWTQNRDWACKANPVCCRAVSAGMYNVHPLLLAAFAIVLPEMDGLLTFIVCVLFSAMIGWLLYRLRKIRFFSLFI